MQFIEEPVDVEEGGGELVEDEREAVIITKRTLETYPDSSLDLPSQLKMWSWEGGGWKWKGHTKPRSDTVSAAAACVNAPHPCTPTSAMHTPRSQRKYPALKPCTIPVAPV